MSVSGCPPRLTRCLARSTTRSPLLTIGEAPRGKSFEDTVRDYLKAELVNLTDDEREAVLTRAELLLREEV